MMKKLLLILTATKNLNKIYLFFAASLLALPSFAGFVVNINLDCPFTPPNADTAHTIKIAGNVISGSGFEKINGVQTTDPLFLGVAPTGVPSNLETAGYHRDSVSYDPRLGTVSCHYASATHPSFAINYDIVNGQAGVIQYQTPHSIMLLYAFGLKKDIK